MFMKDKKEKICIVISYIFIIIMVYYFIFYRILQGSIETRWFYLITIFNVYVLVRTLEALFAREFKMNKIIFTTILWFVLIVSFLFISYKYDFFSSQAIFVSLIKCLFIMSIFALIYMSVVCLNVKNREVLLCLLVLLEGGFYLYSFTNYNEPIKLQYLLDAEDTSAIDYIKNFDSSFYRIIYGTDEDRKSVV